MTATLLFDVLLCALVLGSALCAITGRQVFGAVVFFIVYGVLIAIAWLRLGAIDVALAEAAIGAGLTGVLLIGAAARIRRAGAPVPAAERASDGREEPPDRPPLPVRIVIALASAGVSLALGWAFLALPAPAGLRDAVAGNLDAAGVGNPVTAVLLNFRAWDTLLESIVLLAALIGVWALARNEMWGGRPGLRQHVRAGGVLASFGRVLPPVGLLVGIYLVWAGGDRPGGAFQGGTVLAAVGLLVAMAGLADAPRVTSRALRLALIAGPALFLAVGVAGLAAGGFLVLPPAYAKALILTIEVVLTASIAVTLALLVLGAPERGPEHGDNEEIGTGGRSG